MEITQKIEWRPREAFNDRQIRVTTTEERDGHTHIEQETTKIPADSPVICDICNAEITKFPVCVVSENALCGTCVKRWHIRPGDTEYYETYEFRIGSESARPGVNFGGRKKP